MATRIRLQRFGKKNQPFYHIVIADGRAPRDGRFIEQIGTYNPLTHPADIKINFERALYWVEVGASPSDTARSLLKREGVYLMKHLKGGVAKGAFTEAEAEQKFNMWLQEKEAKLNNMRKTAADKERVEMKIRLEQESKVREAISAKVAAKYAKIATKEAEEKAQLEEAQAEEVEPTAEVEDTPTPETVEVTQEAVEVAPEAVEATPEVVETTPEETAKEDEVTKEVEEPKVDPETPVENQPEEPKTTEE